MASTNNETKTDIDNTRDMTGETSTQVVDIELGNRCDVNTKHYFDLLNKSWKDTKYDEDGGGGDNLAKRTLNVTGDYIRNSQHRELDMHSMYVQALIDTESQDLERQQLKLNSLVTASALLAGFAITCLVELDLNVSLKCISTGTNTSSAGDNNFDGVILLYGVTGLITVLSMLLASVIGIIALMYRSTIYQPTNKTAADSEAQYTKLSQMDFHENHQKELGKILFERMTLLKDTEAKGKKDQLANLYRLALQSFLVGFLFFIGNVCVLIWIKFCAVTSSWSFPLIMTIVPCLFLVIVVGLSSKYSTIVGDLLQKEALKENPTAAVAEQQDN